MPKFDTIIIGAGAMGSAAAYHAAKSGQRVLLLEQFEIDHQRGSSYGFSRIIRYVYDHPIYIKLAQLAYPAWRALEAEADESLMITADGLTFSPPDDHDYVATLSTLRTMAIPFETITPEELVYRYPQFRVPPEMSAFLQADTAVLRASRCVRAQVRLAERYGAVVKDNTPVTQILPNAQGVQVVTATETYSAAHVIITAGGWMRTLMGTVGIELPLVPIAAQENYFTPENPAEYEIGRFPVFLAHLKQEFGYMMYGLPSIDDSGVKIGLHGAPPLDPDGDRVPDPAQIAQAQAFGAKYLTGAVKTHKQSRVCIYTMTPDEHFIIDQHPDYPHVVFASPCSGHGFKFSTVIGRLLAELAGAGQSSFDISFFRLSSLKK